jgi:hypothetical protein
MASDPSRIAFRQMIGVLSQYDKSMIVLKLAGARAKKRAREGRCEGRKPFGYYEGEQKAVERMRALKKEGLGFDRIARQLNRGYSDEDRAAVAWRRRESHSRRINHFTAPTIPIPGDSKKRPQKTWTTAPTERVLTPSWIESIQESGGRW